ncbi:hypothetical protein KUTeg_014440 [Tegillarca granosa]|uniref:Uncharacterized protein n=1 Tax=Tegillarca granosa TaxID=220873 RepID=A0ABQ9F043_TEGGR|nr:hypothetical protein KUTeg_014440 [Tegillarca granosa]
MIEEQYHTKTFTDNSQYVENNELHLGNNIMQTYLWTIMLRINDNISRNIRYWLLEPKLYRYMDNEDKIPKFLQIRKDYLEWIHIFSGQLHEGNKR